MPYVLNLKNLENDDFELAGKEAISNSHLFDITKTTDGFVVTTRVFDDFITSNNLIDPISNALKEVKPYSKILAKKASEEISSLILNSPVPNIIERPIQEAYRNLGNHRQAYVFIQPSNIIPEDYLISEKDNFKDINIRGENDVIYKIKESWISIFTTESIEWRVNSNYSGVLSVGVLIKKMPQSEISGKAYTFNTSSHNKDIVEIQAIYGFDDPRTQKEIGFDIYKVDKKTLKIVEKNIIQQNKMIVRKGVYTPGESPHTQIDISEQWSKSQKLNDSKIIELAEIILNLEHNYSTNMEVSWGLELGDFSILNIEKIKTQKKNLKKESVNLEAYKPTFEILPSENIETKADVDQLVKEVQNSVKDNNANKEDFNKFEINKSQEHKIKQTDIQLKDKKIAEDLSEKHTTSSEEYKFFTPIYLEVSRMNSEVLNKVKQFNGGFLDGTEILLNNNFLPEEVILSQEKFNQSINIFTMDISTSAKVLESKPLIYQFSNVSPQTLKLLGIDESKYTYFNDERFISNPESIAVELLALKKTRNQMNYKNINLIFPNIQSYDNLLKVKKLIASQGLRRSSSLKMYAEVSLPSFVFELKKVEESDVDGVVINYEKLYTNSTGKNAISDNDHKVILNQIEVIRDILNHNKIEFWIKLNNTEYSSEVFKKLLELNISGLIFRDIPSDDFATIFGNAEKENTENLKPQKRGRGRTIKDLL